jgi:hypothetical protein
MVVNKEMQTGPDTHINKIKKRRRRSGSAC